MLKTAEFVQTSCNDASIGKTEVTRSDSSVLAGVQFDDNTKFVLATKLVGISNLQDHTFFKVNMTVFVPIVGYSKTLEPRFLPNAPECIEDLFSVFEFFSQRFVHRIIRIWKKSYGIVGTF